MIKFFRRIRQQLLTENKISKYLLYAIGEIVLVVIGILIALQLNNWNEDRKDGIVERNTLLNLRSDLESALDQLNAKISQNEGYRSCDSILLDAMYFKKELPADSIERLMLYHIYSPGFDPELGTLNEILSTGKMEVIKNNDLRKHISTWNKYMDELDEVDSKLEYLNLQVKAPLYASHIPIRNRLSWSYQDSIAAKYYNYPKSNFKWDPGALLERKEFENMLSNYMIYSTIQHSRLLDIRHNIHEMISIINEDNGVD